MKTGNDYVGHINGADNGKMLQAFRRALADNKYK